MVGSAVGRCRCSVYPRIYLVILRFDSYHLAFLACHSHCLVVWITFFLLEEILSFRDVSIASMLIQF